MTKELNDYIDAKEVRRNLYFAGWSGSILIAICGLYYGLGGRITEMDTRGAWRHFKLEKKVDSLHQIDQYQFQEINEKIDAKPQPSTFRGRYESYTQKWININGKKTLIYIPIK